MPVGHVKNQLKKNKWDSINAPTVKKWSKLS